MRSKRRSLQVALARKRSEVANPEAIFEAIFMIYIDFSFSTTHNPEATQSLPAEIPRSFMMGDSHTFHRDESAKIAHT